MSELGLPAEASIMIDAPERPKPDLTGAEGPWGGPVYSYRGAEIRCAKGGHVCGLPMEDHRPTGTPPAWSAPSRHWWTHG